MSQVFDYGGWLPSPPYKTYGRLDHIVNPTATWVLVDEHPDSINDAAFANIMTDARKAGRSKVVDQPANYHNGAAGFSFSDGHAEIHKWVGSLKQGAAQRIKLNNSVTAPASAGDPDIKWISYR